MKPLSDLSDDELARLARQAEVDLPDAPQWLVESAMALWRAPPATPSLRQRISAVLGFDSWTAHAAVALRSAPPTARHLLFSAEGRDVDLRVSPVDPSSRPPTRFAIAGQVLGPGDSGTVSLTRAGEPVGETALDDFGEFHFADLAGGTYVVMLQVGDDEIVLPEIDVGGEPQR